MNLEDASAKVRIQQFVDQMNNRHSAIIVGKVIFSDQVFSRENGFLLPNLKLNRKKIAQHFLDRQTEVGRAVARSA